MTTIHAQVKPSLLSEPTSQPTPEQQVDALCERIALLESTSEDTNALLPLLHEAQALASEARYQRGLKEVAFLWARWYFLRANYPQAVAHARALHTIALELDDPAYQFRAMNIFGNVQTMIGNYTDALEIFTQFFRLRDIPELRVLRCSVYINIGVIYLQLEQFNQALDNSLRALDYFDDVLPAHRHHVYLNLCDNLAFIYLKLQRGDDARQICERAIDYCEAENIPVPNSLLIMLGKAFQALKDYDRAYELMIQARDVKVGMQGGYWEGFVNLSLGILWAECHDVERAEGHFQAALHYFIQSNTPSEIAQAHEQLYLLYKAHGDMTRALQHCETFHTLNKQLFDDQTDARLKTIQALHDVEKARLERETEFQRSQALRHDLEEREQLIVDLDAYAHSVAHDLKNPLSVIQGAADFLLSFAADADAAQVAKMHSLIHDAAEKSTQIINALLDIAKMRRQEIAPKPVDMARVIEEAIARLNTMLDNRKGQITVEASLPPVLGESTWLEEMWMNLISNGIKYGGTPPQIMISGVQEADGVHFQIRDNGDGMSPSEQKRLFTTFVRLDRHQAQIEGHGLGLSIVKTIIEKLNGKVWLESSGRAGEGAIFHILLPAVPLAEPRY